MIDLGILVLIALYGAFGYWTGVIRRVVGFVALYLGFLAATNAGPTAANVILQAFAGWAIPDAITVGYFLVLVLIVVVLEVMAAFVHQRLQLAAILFDKSTGAILGAVTGLFAATVSLYLLVGGAQPPQGSPTGNQINTLDTIRKATLAPALVRTLGRPAIILFFPVIPTDPNTYFNGQEARAQ